MARAGSVRVGCVAWAVVAIASSAAPRDRQHPLPSFLGHDAFLELRETVPPDAVPFEFRLAPLLDPLWDAACDPAVDALLRHDALAVVLRPETAWRLPDDTCAVLFDRRRGHVVGWLTADDARAGVDVAGWLAPLLEGTATVPAPSVRDLRTPLFPWMQRASRYERDVRNLVAWGRTSEAGRMLLEGGEIAIEAIDRTGEDAFGDLVEESLSVEPRLAPWVEALAQACVDRLLVVPDDPLTEGWSATRDALAARLLLRFAPLVRREDLVLLVVAPPAWDDASHDAAFLGARAEALRETLGARILALLVEARRADDARRAFGPLDAWASARVPGVETMLLVLRELDDDPDAAWAEWLFRRDVGPALTAALCAGRLAEATAVADLLASRVGASVVDACLADARAAAPDAGTRAAIDAWAAAR